MDFKTLLADMCVSTSKRVMASCNPTVLTLSGKPECDAEECMNSTNESLLNVLFHSSSWHFALSSLLNVHLVGKPWMWLQQAQGSQADLSWLHGVWYFTLILDSGY